MSAPLDSLIAETQQSLGALIEKPPLTAKLLMKPPFKFLFDIVINVQQKTGFPGGLFSAEELDFAKIEAKQRQGKIDFLTKLIHCLSLATGVNYEVRASKIVAGLEPENTNIMLHALAHVASNVHQLNLPELVQRTLLAFNNQSGAQPVDQPQQIQAQPESQQQPPAPAPAAATQETAQREQPQQGPDWQAFVQIYQQATPDLAQQIAVTQHIVSPLIAKPKLTEKLLSKPPFRFLHDIVTNLIASTGFPRELLNPDELDSAALNESSQGKFVFLKKLTEAASVGMQSLLGAGYTPVAVNPKKILSGLEPENTNRLLQELAILSISPARDHPTITQALHQLRDTAATQATQPAAQPTTTAVPTPSPPPQQHQVPQVHQQPSYASPEPVAAPVNRVQSPPAQRPAITREPSLSQVTNQTAQLDRKATLRQPPQEPDQFAQAADQNASSSANKMPLPKLSLSSIGKQVSPEDAQYAPKNVETADNDAPRITGPPDNEVAASAASKLKRPRTARPAPPKVRSNIVEESNLQAATAAASKSSALATGVIVEGQKVADEEIESDDDEPGGPGVLQGFQPSDANPDEPHGKLVSDILKHQARGAPHKPAASDESTSKGTMQQLHDLRQHIQALCQSANPLGKCVEFVHEDLDQMNRELNIWKKTFQEQSELLEEESRVTVERLQPLHSKLAAMNAAIEDQNQKILQLKATILRNEAEIQKHLEMEKSEREFRKPDHRLTGQHGVALHWYSSQID